MSQVIVGDPTGPITGAPVRDSKTIEACRAAISGKTRGIRALIPFLGPAFVAAVAYIDPGNYATNIQGGSAYGYNLLWVVVIANLMAMLIQNMSAKLGIATGRNLPELCREYFPKRLTIAMWITAEIGAMATDLAEFLGATLGLNLLFHIPMFPATLITGVGTYLILMLDRFGFRPLERFIAVLVLVIAACYAVETIIAPPAFTEVVYHSVIPWIGDRGSVLLIVGIIGATVMPHVVYLHSSLTQNRIVPRSAEEAIRIHRFGTREIIIAMSLAGLINLSMMYIAANVFHVSGHSQVGDLTTAYQTLTPLLGAAASGVFLVSLLCSGFSSSTVGTMAGQVIMQGFVGFSIPVWIRRVVTMLPTVVIVLIGVNPTQTLVISQVILSLVLPVPIIALIWFTRRKDIMGSLVNKPVVTVLSVACACVITGLNLLLIYASFGGPI